jgi:glycerophosphoryl diester phosphodiesterase
MHTQEATPQFLSRLDGPVIAAHRGASRAARDNSLHAIELAIEFGADMVEIDVRRTRDGVLVAHHDPDVAGVPIADLTYAEVLAREEHPPTTVESIILLGRGRVWFDIELKESGYEEQVLDLVVRFLSPSDFIVTSFLDEAVVAVKELGYRAGLLYEEDFASDHILGRAQRCGADLLLPQIEVAHEKHVQAAAAAGFPVMVWTANDSLRLAQLLGDSRVVGVITDVPDLALAVRNGDHMAWEAA